MLVIKRAYSILLHSLLLAVYAIFFSVQFFFNFDSFARPQEIPAYSIFSQTHVPQKDVKLSAKKQGHPGSKTSLRLNKRFQQEEAPPCEIFHVPSPVQYVVLDHPGHYADHLLLTFFPVSQPLRGPPSASC